MILKQGDIFSSGAHAIVNAVNCVGVMGKGIALSFRRQYPDMYIAYRKQCVEGLLCPGTLHVYKDASGKIIINFPTKCHWKDDADPAYIEAGLTCFLENYRIYGIKSAAFPALGCGLGRLSWAVIKPMMIHYLGQVTIPIEIYEPRESRK